MPANTLKPDPAKCSVHRLHFDRVAQVGLVGAVFADGIGIGNTRELRRHRFAVGKCLEDVAHDWFDGVQHVVLGDKTHLQVELVELARQPVGARVFIAKTRRDLEIPVEAGHHQQLLVLLWRLRQGVELAGMNAAGHKKIAGTLRARMLSGSVSKTH